MSSITTAAITLATFALCLVAGCSSNETESDHNASNLGQAENAPAADDVDEFGTPFIPADMPAALKDKVKALAGKWNLKTQSADSNCGPNAKATVQIYQTYEAEWDAPGDIAPPEGKSFSVHVQCTSSDYSEGYFGKHDKQPSLYAFYILPDEGVCAYSVDWGTEPESDPKVDPNKMHCQKSALSLNKITGKVTSYNRKIPVSADDWSASSDIADFDVAAEAPACSGSLALDGSELTYVYDCNGTKGTFTFTR